MLSSHLRTFGARTNVARVRDVIFIEQSAIPSPLILLFL